jgi:hypothetical protein
MDMLDGFGQWGARQARWLLLAVGAAVGAWLLVQHLQGPPSAQALLQQANPGWQVSKPRHAGLVVQQAGAPELVVDEEAAGPHPLRRLDCAAVLPALPAWLALPPGRTLGCLQTGPAAAPLWVLNHLTPQPIPELWAQRYGPQVEALKLPHQGGWQGGGANGPAGPGVARKHRSMAYRVEPGVRLLAFYEGDNTLMVVTLQR